MTMLQFFRCLLLGVIFPLALARGAELTEFHARGGLPNVAAKIARGDEVRVAYQAPRAVVRADLHYSEAAEGPWEPRVWKTLAATVSADSVTARLPATAAFYFLNLVDERGCEVSTEHEFNPPPVSASEPDP